MKTLRASTWTASLVFLVASIPGAATPPTATDLAGDWSGTVEHGGESTAFGLSLRPRDDGKVEIRMTIPVVHVDGAVAGAFDPSIDGDDVALGPFRFRYDASAGTLRGALPRGLVPVIELPVTLRRGAPLVVPARGALPGAIAEPLWTFAAGAPMWAGVALAGGRVYAGAEQGRLHSLEARTGRQRWVFQAGGAIRTRAVVAGRDIYLQADDGILYCLEAATGAVRWQLRVVATPIVRLPVGDAESRFDRFGSDVTVAGDALYLGTHDGRLLAVDRRRGVVRWEVAVGDSVLAAPAVHRGSVYFGSYDGKVYAVTTAGRRLWEHPVGAPVVSTPAVAGPLVLVGSRSYDFLALDALTGETAWSRYLWFSWVESSATVRDRVAYVGSSDAAAVYAFDAASGRPVWKADVRGWAWGQPALDDSRLYIGTVSNKGYLVDHRGGLVALNRDSGRVLWHFDATPVEGSYGFPGSPAVGDGKVFASGLDGKVHAFATGGRR